MALKVLHLSTYDTGGGAARAAYSLHRALLAHGVTSRMRVGIKKTDDPTVVQGNRRKFVASSLLDRQLWRLQRSPRTTWRSPARFSSISAREINASGADVVNLHWVNDGFISVEEIGRIDKPIVWSMYDMWPFAGTEHYGSDTPGARWRTGHTKSNRPSDEHGVDLDRWTFERKQRHWLPNHNTTIHMVPASTWLEQATRSSALMRDWPITRIPHVVDTDVLAPMNKHEARWQLDLPEDRPTILFLASAGIGDHRKGWDLLKQAMPNVAKHHPNLQIVIVGPIPNDEERNQAQQATKATIYWYRTVTTSEQLRRLYCAADVTAVPSREDNMPLTAMEAQSCGCPVVGFSIGGLPDIVEHETTGYLARQDDTEELGNGLNRVLRASMQQASRNRALRIWSPPPVVARYLTLYQAAH